MASQVFDLRLSNGMTRAQSNEHLRSFSQRAYEEKRTRNFDPTREKLNFEVQKGGVIKSLDKGCPLDKRIKENLKSRGIMNPNEGLKMDDPNRRRTVVDIILEGSRDRMRELAFGKQEIMENDGVHIPDNSSVTRHPEIEQWALDMYGFMCGKFGEQNIVAFVVHLDEKNPHAHCTLLPVAMVKGKQRISVKSVFGQNKYEWSRKLKDLHSELAEVNAKWGLERGKDVKVTGAKHRTSEEYWKELQKSCTELERKADAKQSELDTLNEKEKLAEKRGKGLTTMIENLEKQLLDRQAELAYVQSQMEEGKEKQQKLSRLQLEIESVEAKLEDKKQKLDKAKEEIWELGGKHKRLQDEMTEMSRQINRMSPDLKDQIVVNAEALAWQMACLEAKNKQSELAQYRKSLPVEERNAFDKFQSENFDDTVFGDMAERGAEIITVTVSLFMGYIDSATTFAQGHGGGGGPGTGWGRKKDEDDRNYMGRCFGMARRMMHPTGRQIKR